MYEYTEWVLSKSMFIFLGSHSVFSAVQRLLAWETRSALGCRLLAARLKPFPPSRHAAVRDFERGITLSLWRFCFSHHTKSSWPFFRRSSRRVLYALGKSGGCENATTKQIRCSLNRHRNVVKPDTLNNSLSLVMNFCSCQDTVQHIVCCYLW